MSNAFDPDCRNCMHEVDDDGTVLCKECDDAPRQIKSLRTQLAACRAAVREARTVVDHTTSHTAGAGCVYTCVACGLDAALAGGEG